MKPRKEFPKMGSHYNRELKQLLLEQKRNARFFQIILEAGEGRLVIPRKFARDYANDLLNEVFLEVPTGAVWKVELVKSEGRLWLQNGWGDFQEYYSIGYGAFLMFEYTARSYFHVVICDQSASEIEYPVSIYDDCQEPELGGDYDEAETEINGEDNEIMEILNECLPSSKKRKNLALPCPRPPKMRRTSSSLKSEAKRVEENVSSCKLGKNRINKKREVLEDDEKTEAFMKSLRAPEEAAGLKDENLTFVVVIKPSHVDRRSNASLPINFVRKHLTRNGGKFILQISRRKIWNVNFRRYGGKRKRARFSHGWHAFMLDNNLKTGDVCVFKLIDRAKLLLKVVIYRGGKGIITVEPKEKFLLPCPRSACKTTAKLDSSLELHTNVAPENLQLSCIKSKNSRGDMNLSDPELQFEDTCKEKKSSARKHKVSRINVMNKSLTADEKDEALRKASGAFKSANPFFMLAMQPAYVRTQLSLPFEFVKSHFKKENGEVVLQVSDGRAWTVHYNMKIDQRKARFLCSWIPFARDNNLAVGDVCIFELIESTKTVFKVTIFRAGDVHPSSDLSGSMHDSRGNVKEIEFGSTPKIDKAEATCSSDGISSGKITVYEEKPGTGLPESPLCSWVPKVVQAAETFTSMYPSFKVFMEISNLQEKVTVPAKFMKLIKQGTEKALKVQLQVGDNVWPVKLSRKCTIGKLTTGWDVFSRENRLQVGDFCIFELVDSESPQLKVSILRHDV